MRRLLKFMHTMGAIGLIGSMATLVVLERVSPPASSLAEFAAVRAAMAAIGTWIFLPSLAVTLIAGLSAIAVTRAYHNAGWAWAKLVSGVLIFEGGLQGVQAPLQDRASEAAKALQSHTGALESSLHTEQATLWVLLAVATANVVLGIWRPRLTKLPD